MSSDCVVQTWNPGADRLLGHREASIVGQPIHIVMPLESHELFTACVQQIRAGMHTRPYNTQWRCSDGTLVDVAVNVFALRDGGDELLGFSAVARDITAQIRAQRQLEKLARFDVLTGLVNRAETLSRLQAALDNPRVPVATGRVVLRRRSFQDDQRHLGPRRWRFSAEHNGGANTRLCAGRRHGWPSGWR